MAGEEITKVQELIYTSRVDSVMAENVVVVEPSLTMADVKNLFRLKRISGAPVVEQGRIIGIVTITDLLEAVEKGKLQAPVTEVMTRPVKTLMKDSPLSEAVNTLGREGFDRFPVVDAEGKLVGIVTPGTVVRSLLRQMDASYSKKEAEKLPSYRASHIFEDIPSDNTSLILRFVVDEKDFSNAGKASSMIKKSLQRLRLLPSLVRRIAVAVYEAEMNLVIHTDVGGEIIVDIHKDHLKISAVDHGPGIENISQVLQPGYSTAPGWIREMGFGAGMGLANIKRCTDTMVLISEYGGGTRLDMEFLIRDAEA
jgi:CBS domain-containing protein/anti-sigma regulatory factor (Ser/Thr protein kinase)